MSLRSTKYFFSKALVVVLLVLVSSCQKVEDESNDICIECYEDITIIDVHNHDASGGRYHSSMQIWDDYGIDKVVLFGNISEPSAVRTDESAFNAYMENPNRIYPFIAGINIHQPSCLTYIQEQFDNGVVGIGEVVGASTYSPVASNLPWKGEHPLDGYFPEIYELCTQYQKPILLHIDPPNGFPIEKLREAATLYPNTNFIFGHANAYNSPSNIEILLQNHNNIYIDFFAGFTRYNSDSNFRLSDFVPLIHEYPDRFMISSDSGYGVGYDEAYSAIYELFDLLDSEVVPQIAGKNFMNLIESE